MSIGLTIVAKNVILQRWIMGLGGQKKMKKTNSNHPIFLFANGACCNDYFGAADRKIVLSYMNHVHLFRTTGDASYLAIFEDRSVWNRDGDELYRFETRPAILRQLIKSLGE